MEERLGRVVPNSLILPLLVSAFWVSGCKAQQVPATWQNECVGRLSISMPGPIDVGAMRWDQFRDRSDASHYQFADEEPASYTNFQYGGYLAITHPLTRSQIEEVTKESQASKV